MFGDLIETEHGAILTDEFLAYVTSSALAYSALHLHLERRVDTFVRPLQFPQSGSREFYHYRWSAHDRHPVIRLQSQVFDNDWNHADPAVPTFKRNIDRCMQLNSLVIFPDAKVFFV